MPGAFMRFGELPSPWDFYVTLTTFWHHLFAWGGHRTYL